MSASAAIARRSAATRRKASVNSCRLSARITPRLADRESGLITHGKSTCLLISAMSSQIEKRLNCGHGTPRVASVCRNRYLSRVAFADSIGLCGSPSASDAVVASSVVSSSTPTIAAIGCAAANSTIICVAAAGALKSSTRESRGERSAVVAASSEATITSTSSFIAAARKSVAR